MGHVRRVGALAAVAALLWAAGCTSESAGDDDDAASSETTAGGDDTGRATGAGNTTGITDTTIKIALVSSDLSQLSEQNLAPEIGSADATMKAVVADINANGGVAGRQIELISHVIPGAEAIVNPDAGAQACVQATEDDQPFAVILAASMPASMVQCIAEDHDPLTITMDSWPDSLYEAADGRLFSVGSHISVGMSRMYSAWPGILDDAGALEGKTIGIIRQDTSTNDQKEAVDNSLKPALEALGYTVAAEAVLPCPEASQTCEQHQAAIQRMQDAGVDFVFLVAQTLAGSTTVETAKNSGFEPTWATVGNNVTNTVARFYTNAKDNYDGAWGLSVGFTDFSDAAAECNEIAVAGGAEAFEAPNDGYGFTGVTCLQMQILASAIESVEGDLDQASVIAALEALGDVPTISGPATNLSADKHDAGNAIFLSRYSAATEVFEPVDNRAPIEVPE
jgi:ABC-type branched-subunit amino acid transport system substrate-binding protein